MANNKLNAGPENAMINVSLFLFFNLKLLTGILRDQPKLRRIKQIIQIGSICFKGLAVYLLSKTGVLSPSFTAIKAWAYSCNPNANRIAGERTKICLKKTVKLKLSNNDIKTLHSYNLT